MLLKELVGDDLAAEALYLSETVIKKASRSGAFIFWQVMCCAQHQKRSTQSGFYMVNQIVTSDRIHSTSCTCRECGVDPNVSSICKSKFNTHGILMCRHQLAVLIADASYLSKVKLSAVVDDNNDDEDANNVQC